MQDHLGIKPLFPLRQGATIVFAVELNLIKSMLAGRLTVNREAVPYFLRIPADGYTAVVQRMIDHSAITVHLKKVLRMGWTCRHLTMCSTPARAIKFIHQFGRLGNRTVTFEKDYAGEDFQGTAQMNFCDLDIPYTRITEINIAPWEKHDRSIYFREYSKETNATDQPYYPQCQKTDKQLRLCRVAAN